MQQIEKPESSAIIHRRGHATTSWWAMTDSNRRPSRC